MLEICLALPWQGEKVEFCVLENLFTFSKNVYANLENVPFALFTSFFRDGRARGLRRWS